MYYNGPKNTDSPGICMYVHAYTSTRGIPVHTIYRHRISTINFHIYTLHELGFDSGGVEINEKNPTMWAQCIKRQSRWVNALNGARGSPINAPSICEDYFICLSSDDMMGDAPLV